MRKYWIYVAFLTSGSAGLMYEISWSRQIGLLFGHTAQAAAIVVSGFFAGMGLGYLLAASWIRRIRPLLGYALAEWTVALWACLIPTLLTLLESPSVAPFLHHPNPSLQTALRALVCFLLLLPATIALGATLPFIAQYLAPSPKHNRARVAIAYALNTTGALLGVITSSVFLLVTLGVRRSSYLAAALSLISGLIVFVVSRRIPATAPPESSSARKRRKRSPLPGSSFGLCLFFVALSGFGTLCAYVRSRPA